MRALIVDDEAEIRDVLAAMLARLGFLVDQAAGGVEGLDRVRREPRPDLVVLDWRMSGGDGPGFLRSVRSDPALGALPVLMLTGLTEPAHISEALRLGATDYLMKPITRQSLKEKLLILGLVEAA